ncbi:MAG TPA: hypothetical protein PLL06_20250 [Acidobacteriota bacterium]|nr:hypothetical protein [Acidobacteriota bacterium]
MTEGKDFLLGMLVSCRQLIEYEPLGAGRMPAFPGNIYLKNYISLFHYFHWLPCNFFRCFSFLNSTPLN